MSEDEVFVTVISSAASLVCWVWWYGSTLTSKSSPVAGRTPARGLLLASPLVALTLLVVILRLWSASDVRDDGGYMTMYTLMGLAWCGVASFIPAWLGISFRHDVLNLANHAAGWVCCGWILGVMLSFAGGNIGDGPGWWVVVFSSLLSTGMLTLVFFAWEKLTGSHDAITIDRDVATGLRMFGLFAACGAVFGVSAAGDWQSADATIRDFFLTAWPAVPILLAAIVFHRILRPTAENPRPAILGAGVFPMLVLLFMSLMWVLWIGSRIVGDAV